MFKVWVMTRDYWTGSFYRTEVQAVFNDADVAKAYSAYFQKLDNADVGNTEIEELEILNEIPTYMRKVVTS